MKKIGFISDLHIDSSPRYATGDFLSTMAQVMQDRRVDALVIGGDIANHYSMTLKFVERLQNITGIPVYFIPGNHDLWEIDAEVKNTHEVYDIFKQHPQSLLEKPLRVSDQFTIVAHPGWYNHTYHDQRFSKDELEIGKYRMATWQDKVHMDWQITDPELSRLFAEQVEKDLLKVESNKIILVTHVITIPEFTIPMPHKIFDFFNAYIATNDFDSIYEKFNIDYSIMGHVHFRGSVNRDGTNFITNSLGYQKEWRTLEMYREMSQSLWVIDVG